MLISLLLPIVLCTVALFFASFVSWMLVPLHFKDWNKMDKEDDFLKAVKDQSIPPGNYMFPGWNTPDEMKSEEYQQKYEAGPCGIITVFPKTSMGRNLAMTVVYFFVVSFCLGYLATVGLSPGDDFLKVFRFVSTAGLMTFLAAMVQHSIWFRNRILGHVVESVAYAAIAGVIFALLWPAS